ncbi:TetR/AcrR family transcriptional regulator [Actinokineospora fastidiosa]|uniref:TetR family transcriptional regulator n=1 Tax=Actinokineospora fastidiosa TaxID=1816 RepID=A0A918G7M7_9PSEU|nr:TetR/AcrR family transcriptional regulator [Actinokineospora fastidiosa]GGS21648.1 TetR family transcriptional regulator [Actinokineospora fastidiosa]
MDKPLRADAARNRGRLLDAAAALFAERGMDVPMEHIAKRAGLSIGTLYAHFPTRQAFFDAIFPDRLAELDRVAERALAEPDPWAGFVAFLEGIFALQAGDRGLNDAIARRFPTGPEVEANCVRGVGRADEVIERAKAGGRLRPDFSVADLTTLTWAMSQVIRESGPWRRLLALVVDGLRAEGGQPERSTQTMA